MEYRLVKKANGELVLQQGPNWVDMETVVLDDAKPRKKRQGDIMSCSQCSYMQRELIDGKPFCLHPKRHCQEILRREPIPEWCPLEDA